MKLTYAIMAAMLATATLAVQGAPYDTNTTDGDTNCGNERLNGGLGGDNDFVQCQTVSGPGGLTIKPVVGVGLGFCTGPDLGPANIFPCFTVGSTNVGAAIFSSNGFDNSIAGNREVSVWAEWVGGIPGTGFEMTVCNDRDFDSTCTNIGNDADQLRNGYSNEPLVGAGCEDDEKNKDDKDCGADSTDAEVKDFCMMPANVGAPFANWNDGQIVVFIGAWVAADPFTPNIGAGVSTGTYEVWMKLSNDGTNPTTCTPPECDDRVDNNGDGTSDFDDPGCSSYDDPSEAPECSDGVDNNDNDMLADEDDPDCYDVEGNYNPNDNNEKSLLEWVTRLL